jgi:hypothetical protein
MLPEELGKYASWMRGVKPKATPAAIGSLEAYEEWAGGVRIGHWGRFGDKKVLRGDGWDAR